MEKHKRNCSDEFGIQDVSLGLLVSVESDQITLDLPGYRTISMSKDQLLDFVDYPEVIDGIVEGARANRFWKTIFPKVLDIVNAKERLYSELGFVRW